MNKVEQDHFNMVQSLVKSGDLILATLTPDKVDLWHAATGISTEAGEFLDCIKKHVVYDQPLNRENALEELGCLEFYMAQARQRLHITRDDCLLANTKKLLQRYPDFQYTDARAKERADKVERS